jgi:hypothetical protein
MATRTHIYTIAFIDYPHASKGEERTTITRSRKVTDFAALSDRMTVKYGSTVPAIYEGRWMGGCSVKPAWSTVQYEEARQLAVTMADARAKRLAPLYDYAQADRDMRRSMDSYLAHLDHERTRLAGTRDWYVANAQHARLNIAGTTAAQFIGNATSYGNSDLEGVARATAMLAQAAADLRPLLQRAEQVDRAAFGEGRTCCPDRTLGVELADDWSPATIVCLGCGHKVDSDLL